MKPLRSRWYRRVATLAASWLYCALASAQAIPAGGGGLPWESPLTTLQTSLTGPIAKAIGVIALAVSGGMLAFGGELNEFTKRIMMVVLALSVMLLAGNFISALGL